jgi:cell division inhibitor SulA/protein ImuA
VRVSVAELSKLPGVWRGGELEHAAQPVVATGHAALDRELPGGGWPTGTLTEVLHDGVGIGEVGFLAGALAKADAERLIAWINPPHLPYAPAILQSCIPLHRCLVLRPRDKEDALWASEQALRSGACSAALLWLAQDDYAWLRRLQRRGARWPYFSARPPRSACRLLRICESCFRVRKESCGCAFPSDAARLS